MDLEGREGKAILHNCLIRIVTKDKAKTTTLHKDVLATSAMTSSQQLSVQPWTDAMLLLVLGVKDNCLKTTYATVLSLALRSLALLCLSEDTSYPSHDSP
jgi:hypothetical protein